MTLQGGVGLSNTLFFNIFQTPHLGTHREAHIHPMECRDEATLLTIHAVFEIIYVLINN